MDPSYGNLLRIGDKVSWNHYISKAKREQNTDLLSRAKEIKANEDLIIQFEYRRQDNPSLTWDIFKQQHLQPIQLPFKTYPLNLVLKSSE
jgi:hypothetical protein